MKRTYFISYYGKDKNSDATVTVDCITTIDKKLNNSKAILELREQFKKDLFELKKSEFDVVIFNWKRLRK